MSTSKCPKCKGKGTIKCTNKKCDNGLVYILVPTPDGGMASNFNPCTVCGGTMKEKCPRCAGKGYL